MIDGVSALGAAKAAAETFGSSGTAAASSAPAGGDFGQVMNQVVSDAVGTLETGEATAIQGLQGNAPAFKVVEAVMSAQRTLQSVLAIRDKAVSAYQEISRMAI